MLDDKVRLYPMKNHSFRARHRQTTLPPVGRGPRLRRFAPFRSRSTSQTSPPSARGVCLISSSCPGSQTTMTGSNLAGQRLVGSARHAVLRTALLARRGGARPPLKWPPPPGASRLLLHTSGAQTPFLMERRSAPSGGGQCRAIGRGWGEANDRARSSILKRSQ